jgi:hypothetical protein
MDIAFSLLLLVGLVAFALVALLARTYYVLESRRKEQQHLERMKSLELGLPLPDAEIARAKAESNRSSVTGAIGILVPLAAMCGAAGTTALLLAKEHPVSFQLPLLCTVWGVCGLISVVTVVLSLIALGTSPRSTPVQDRPQRGSETGKMSAREPIIEESVKA